MEDRCEQAWAIIFILPFIAGLVGGGIWGYKGLGGKAANWVMGSEEQAVSKRLPAGTSSGDTEVACLSCGASVDADGSFCTSCGAPKQYEPEVTTSVPSLSDKITRWARFGILVIHILLFIRWVGADLAK